jgi:hypothetical protein
MTAIVHWRKSSRSTGQSECVEVGSWRKSSRSAGQAECVEVGTAAPANWRKSARSNSQAECVEVGTTQQIVAVRDTKDRNGPALSFESDAWMSFVLDLKTR